MSAAWNTPSEVLAGLRDRLEKGTHETNARVPGPHRHDVREYDGWVFGFEHEEHWIYVCFIKGQNAFMRAHQVEDVTWVDWRPELPALALDPEFRSAFEWFIKNGPGRKEEDLDFTARAVRAGDPLYFQRFNRSPMVDGEIVSAV